MSNDNEIYPLEREWMDRSQDIRTRSVNHRLAPIFEALADDPDGWEKEWFRKYGGEWHPALGEELPRSHESCEVFRLVRKPKTITVKMDEPVKCVKANWFNAHTLALVFRSEEERAAVYEAIRKAMEGK